MGPYVRPAAWRCPLPADVVADCAARTRPPTAGSRCRLLRRQLARFFAIIDRPELAGEERFATLAAAPSTSTSCTDWWPSASHRHDRGVVRATHARGSPRCRTTASTTSSTTRTSRPWLLGDDGAPDRGDVAAGGTPITFDGERPPLGVPAPGWAPTPKPCSPSSATRSDGRADGSVGRTARGGLRVRREDGRHDRAAARSGRVRRRAERSGRRVDGSVRRADPCDGSRRARGHG